MSGPRAVGHRIPYAAAPDAVREWVDAALGSPVVEVADQVGGFSPGPAARVRCADGTRAFVKGVGSELNPDSPTLFRREVQALTLLGSHPLWADLLASYDADGWVVLVLEDVEGTNPDLADDATMERLLAATDELVRVLQERVPEPPEPPAGEGIALYRPGLVDLRAVFESWLTGLDHATELPAHLVPRWVGERADDLRAGLSELAATPMQHLVHYDIRNDNLLVRPGGEVVFVDWGACGVGPDWLDPMLARVERVHLPWFDESLATSPALARAGDDLVTASLVGVGTYLAYRAHTSEVVGLPTINDFRRTESARFLAAAARRLGFGH